MSDVKNNMHLVPEKNMGFKGLDMGPGGYQEVSEQALALTGAHPA